MNENLMPKYRVSGIAMVPVQWAVEVEAPDNIIAARVGQRHWDERPHERRTHIVSNSEDHSAVHGLGALDAEKI